MGEKELDKRFKAMNSFPGLRHFKKGISSVTQWTGTEHKEMEKLLLGVVIGGVSNRFLPVIRWDRPESQWQDTQWEAASQDDRHKSRRMHLHSDAQPLMASAI